MNEHLSCNRYACGLIAASVLAVVAASCVTPDPSTTLARNFQAVEVRNGLSDAEREAFYHVSEGSELAPLALFELLHVINGRRLSDWLEGFGFIPDPQSEHGLPIGFSVSKSRAHGIKMVGINCAACHVTDIHYQGKRFRVDGAPNQVDIIRFYRDLADHSLAIAQSADRVFSLFRNSQPKHVVSQNFIEQIPTIDALSTDSEYGQQMADRFGHVLAAEQRNVAHGIESSGHDYVHDVLTGKRLEQDANVIATHVASLTAAPPVPGQSLHSVLGTDRQAAASDVFEDFGSFARLLHAQVTYLQRLKDIVDEATVQTGPGRIDAFGIVRNLLFIPKKEVFPIDAPVSIPHLWRLKDVHWLHWNANTNSVMQRNIAQALGTGAYLDQDTWDTTVDIENLDVLEKLSQKIESPKWPEEVLGPIDQQATARGRVTYQALCARCHDAVKHTGPLIDYELFGLADSREPTDKRVDTDSNYAHNFDVPVGNEPFALAVQDVVSELENHYYDRHAVSTATRDAWKGEHRHKVEWRTPLSKNNTTDPVHPVYPARPLSGVWATAPYLHNGSVPSLYALLTRYEKYFVEEDKTFHIGHREFDPVHVGYANHADDDIASHRFDTTLPGNSPRGHLFGVDLPEKEKMDLVEYLKTL